MPTSRVEISLKRLLPRCEVMAREEPQNYNRLEQYIILLDSKLEMLEKDTSKPSIGALGEYRRRVWCLKEVAKRHRLSNPVENIVSAQLLSPPGPTSAADTITKEIGQTAISKYSKDLRDQLFQSDTEDGHSLRQRKPEGKYLDHIVQEKIEDDMLSLTPSVNEQSELANTIIKTGTEVAEKSSNPIDEDSARIKVESEKLEEHRRRVWTYWIWNMVAGVVIIFTDIFLFMCETKKGTS